MISGQRKVHKFIWLVLAVVLPVLLFLAIRNLNFSPTQIVSVEEQVIAKMIEGKVEIELNIPFESPSAVVYELTHEGKTGRVLGQLEGAGTYSFPASENSRGILVLDNIKNEELLKIEF